ncbi:MAG: secondary thiamine-phosphate synthase enzyme YjbQ [Candidatus Omnitrophica bacterium]|jgi:secondary thiamine-phosphate synthase enzyme|nr:secondary thiamine-phosphate synthase enzyme YjbQ [Candidatus Omnitrophota bacterium]MCF7917260.1 secondary thiamine-phosphate synthase enzyme YjbQ [Candidatus Omnitrophota bacterium]
MLKTRYIEKKLKPESDIADITSDLEAIIRDESLTDALLFLSSIGSTGALTTVEFEPGLIKDLQDSFAKLFPFKKGYSHNDAWADDNAHSHLRSSFLKTNFFVSVTGGKLDLGTWQQVVLLNFDTKTRNRKIAVKILS